MIYLAKIKNTQETFITLLNAGTIKAASKKAELIHHNLYSCEDLNIEVKTIDNEETAHEIYTLLNKISPLAKRVVLTTTVGKALTLKGLFLHDNGGYSRIYSKRLNFVKYF